MISVCLLYTKLSASRGGSPKCRSPRIGGKWLRASFLGAELNSTTPALLDTGSRPQAGQGAEAWRRSGRKASRKRQVPLLGLPWPAAHRRPTPPPRPTSLKRCWVGSPEAGEVSSSPKWAYRSRGVLPLTPASATLSFLFWCVLTCLARWSLRMKRLAALGQASVSQRESAGAAAARPARCEAFTAEEPVAHGWPLARVPPAAAGAPSGATFCRTPCRSPARGQPRVASSCPALCLPGRRPPLGSWGQRQRRHPGRGRQGALACSSAAIWLWYCQVRRAQHQAPLQRGSGSRSARPPAGRRWGPRRRGQGKAAP